MDQKCDNDWSIKSAKYRLIFLNQFLRELNRIKARIIFTLRMVQIIVYLERIWNISPILDCFYTGNHRQLTEANNENRKNRDQNF